MQKKMLIDKGKHLVKAAEKPRLVQRSKCKSRKIMYNCNNTLTYNNKYIHTNEVKIMTRA